MVVAENEARDDQRDLNVNVNVNVNINVVGGPKSLWKTPAILDSKATEDAPVMGAESWSALADVHRPKNFDAAAKPPAAEPSPLPAAQACRRSRMGLETLVLHTSIHHHITKRALGATQMLHLLFQYPYPTINQRFVLFFILWYRSHRLLLLGMLTSHILDPFQVLKIILQSLDVRIQCKLLCNWFSLNH